LYNICNISIIIPQHIVFLVINTEKDSRSRPFTENCIEKILRADFK